jgi:hypothetical protein
VLLVAFVADVGEQLGGAADEQPQTVDVVFELGDAFLEVGTVGQVGPS